MWMKQVRVLIIFIIIKLELELDKWNPSTLSGVAASDQYIGLCYRQGRLKGIWCGATCDCRKLVGTCFTPNVTLVAVTDLPHLATHITITNEILTTVVLQRISTHEGSVFKTLGQSIARGDLALGTGTAVNRVQLSETPEVEFPTS